MRPLAFALIVLLATSSGATWAVEESSNSPSLNTQNVLRGQFVEEHLAAGGTAPLQSSGHFVAAPSLGLIWSLEKPFPTSTIITPHGAVQDVGGFAMPLSIKNLAHLYAIVRGALEGRWDVLNADFAITRTGDRHWQRILTPRHNGTSALATTTIAVSGGRFIENIVMTKADGNCDSFHFSNESLSPAPPTAQEIAAFRKVAP